jgi:hypothetical protein
MSLFSTIISLRKTTLRRDIIVENKDITLAPWLLNTRQDREKTRQQTKDKAADKRQGSTQKTRQQTKDKPRQDKTETRQDKTRQDKTRQG